MSGSAATYTFNGVPDTVARTVTTTIAGATFSDGAVLSGSWTASYDNAGNLLDQISGSFIVTGPAGTATFRVAGTLPYANTASNSSYEIHLMSRSGTGYDWLYVDWQGETPNTLALGTPSLYTSVRSSGCLLPLRLTNGGTATPAATCFLAGSMILTPQGEVPVETLRAGQPVCVLREGVTVVEPVLWVGSRSVTPLDALVPIRIRADAFAPGMPHADLLLTPEHCVLMGGGLVPVRMLVNGASIVEEHCLKHFRYHHVELERHGILVAEGLSVESYLDTGNRSNFGESSVVALQPDFAVSDAAVWQTSACAPLRTDRETVEPIWRRLLTRAGHLRYETTRGEDVFGHDPQLRLLLDDNRTLLPVAGEVTGARFDMPHGTSPVALLSRASKPSEVVGPFVDDRRLLGVKVAALAYGPAGEPVAVSLETLAACGWHGTEPDGRWTDGAARLFLPPAERDTVLVVRLSATVRYREEKRAA